MHIEGLDELDNKILAVIKSEAYRPMKAKDLAVLMNVPREEKKDFFAAVEALLSDGKIVEDHRNLLKLPGENVFSGIFKKIRIFSWQSDFFSVTLSPIC